MRTAITVMAMISAVLAPDVVHSATTSFTCKFPTAATPEGLSPQKDFVLRFVVDTSAKKAYLIGNAGSSEVTIVINAAGISFLEITGTGNVMVTAITSAGEAVHSRNSIISEGLVPSQHYGKCVIQ
jgi:hypothetical protein